MLNGNVTRVTKNVSRVLVTHGQDVSVAIWEMLLNVTDEGFSVSISMQRFAMQGRITLMPVSYTFIVELLGLFFITCYIIVVEVLCWGRFNTF